MWWGLEGSLSWVYGRAFRNGGRVRKEEARRSRVVLRGGGALDGGQGSAVCRGRREGICWRWEFCGSGSCAAYGALEFSSQTRGALLPQHPNAVSMELELVAMTGDTCGRLCNATV